MPRNVLCFCKRSLVFKTSLVEVLVMLFDAPGAGAGGGDGAGGTTTAVEFAHPISPLPRAASPSVESARTPHGT